MPKRGSDMDHAAYFALPMPVRQAASVSTHDKNTAETALARTSRTRSAASAGGSDGKRSATAVFARKNSPSAQGTARSNV